MARITRTVTELSDDIDGGDAAETVSFALDGASYEIDLNEENAAALREAIGPWIGHARRAGRGSRGRRAAAPAAARRSGGGSGNSSDVRAWARENGYEVSERGRISADIQAAYEAAH